MQFVLSDFIRLETTLFSEMNEEGSIVLSVKNAAKAKYVEQSETDLQLKWMKRKAWGT